MATWQAWVYPPKSPATVSVAQVISLGQTLPSLPPDVGVPGGPFQSLFPVGQQRHQHSGYG